MSEDDKRKSIQMETAEILLKYLKTISCMDPSRFEWQTRAVPEIALAIKDILRDL